MYSLGGGKSWTVYILCLSLSLESLESLESLVLSLLRWEPRPPRVRNMSLVSHCHWCNSHRTGRSQVIDINNWTPVSVTWNCVNSSSLSHVTVMCHWSKNITLSTTLSTRISLKKMTSCNTVINKCPKYIFCCIMQATKNRWIGDGCRIQTKNWSDTL